MNYSKNHRMAGHFVRAFDKNRKFVEDEKSLTVRIAGFNKSKLAQTDINYICSFYHIPWTENWLIEGTDTYNYNVVIKKEEPTHEC